MSATLGPGEETTSTLMQVVGRIQFSVVPGVPASSMAVNWGSLSPPRGPPAHLLMQPPLPPKQQQHSSPAPSWNPSAFLFLSLRASGVTSSPPRRMQDVGNAR